MKFMTEPLEASSSSHDVIPANTDASFAMLTCAHGAESVVKSSITDAGWRLAFSRPGFVTAKHEEPGRTPPNGTFIRTAATSIGSTNGQTLKDHLSPMVDLLDPIVAEKPFDHLHVFPRDRVPVGKFGFEPGVDAVCEAVAREIRGRLGERVVADEPNQIAEPWQRVLDVVLISPSHWFLGVHRASSVPLRWPGGVQPIVPKYEPISRAYYKAAEAIAWSEFELAEGDTAVEVGAAPGGACGRLLELGLNVIAVDPAPMDPRIAKHPRLKHYGARGGDLPRRVYSEAKWLLVDSNVRPDQTLTTIENIVLHPSVNLAGALITMKIGGYEHADRLRGWSRRIATWQPSDVKVRHLARNKIEVCYAVRFG